MCGGCVGGRVKRSGALGSCSLCAAAAFAVLSGGSQIVGVDLGIGSDGYIDLTASSKASSVHLRPTMPA